MFNIKRDKRFIIFLIIVVLIFIIQRLWSYSYNQDIIVLTPKEGSIKIKPKYVGGIVMPYSNNFLYNSLNSNQSKHYKTHILPSPEEPLIIEGHNKIKQILIDSMDAILSQIEYYEEKVSKYDDLEQDNNYILPNKLRIITNREDFDDTENSENSNDNIIKVSNSTLKITRA